MRWLVESICIVTTVPNELCATVNDRMPLILREKDYPTWLDAKAPVETVSALLRPFSATDMDCYPVSNAVNNARNETASCLDKVDWPAPRPGDQLMLF